MSKRPMGVTIGRRSWDDWRKVPKGESGGRKEREGRA
jgi:hypothetical protein